MTFPEHVKDYDFKNLMQHMLDKNLETRYSKIDGKFTPKPYAEFVKTLNDWEPPKNMPEPERLRRIEFNEWLKKF